MSSLTRQRTFPLLLLLLLASVGYPAFAQATAEEAVEAAGTAETVAEVVESSAADAVRDEVEESFRILRLRDGLLLEPRDDLDGVAAVEIVNGSVVIDGETVSDAEMEERLGSTADVVRRLAELENEGRRATFDGEGVSPSRASPNPRPARPRRPPRPHSSSRTDSQVVVGNSVVIEADEEARDVVVFGGRLTIRGRVIGDAVSIGGSVLLESGGEVTGDLAAIGGPATVEAGAEVHGDLISVGNEVQLDDGAILGGKLVEVPFVPSISFGFSDNDWDWDWDSDNWDRGSGWGFGKIVGIFWQFIALVLWALLACLAYLLARGPVERMEAKLRVEPWKAALVGLAAALLFLPVLFVVFIILLVSIIGWLLLPLLPFAVMAIAIVAFLGGTAVALRLGRWTEETLGWKMVNPYVAIVVGVALIQVWSFIADLLDLAPGPVWPLVMMFWFVGCVVQLAVLLLGLGAALLTRFGTQDEFSGGAGALPPIPPVGSAGSATSEADYQAVEQPAPLPDLDWDSSEAESGARSEESPGDPESAPESEDDRPKGPA